MRNIEHTVCSNGFVGNYRFSECDKQNAYSLVVYLRPGACYKVEQRRQALSNLADKLNDLSGIERVEKGLIGTQRQNGGYMGSLRVFTA